jgi:hypothetical protein
MLRLLHMSLGVQKDSRCQLATDGFLAPIGCYKGDHRYESSTKNVKEKWRRRDVTIETEPAGRYWSFIIK